MNQKVSSKFSFVNIYLMYGFMVALLLLAVYLISHSEIILHTKFDSTMGAAYAGLLFLVIPVLYFYFNQKYLLGIFVTDDAIVIKSFFWQRRYSLSDIQSIDLFARKNLGLLSGKRRSNGISIVTIERSYFLNSLYYRNTPEIKAAIYKAFKPVIKSPVNKVQDVRSASSVLSNLTEEKFYNSYFFSVDSITIAFSYVLLLLFLGNESTKVFLWLGLGMTVLFLFSSVFKANYFLVSSTQLIVKNQVLWNRNIVFDFDNIANVILEEGYKQSNSLRINTNDFQTRVFQSGGLWNTTWRRLIQRLQTAGVDVRNDTYL